MESVIHFLKNIAFTFRDWGWQESLLYCIVPCCIAIFLTGIVKKAVLNKVENKKVRKLLCFLTGLLLTGLAGLGYLFCDGKDIAFLPSSLVVLLPLEIIVYQLYENTLLRDGIDAIGRGFVQKFIPAIANLFSGKKNSKATLITIQKAAKADAAKEIKKLADQELKNL